jgi:hypothetical protein
MHEDTVQVFYRCKGCGKVLKPFKGECCVFCAYGDTPCPTTQMYTGRRENHGAAASWSWFDLIAAQPSDAVPNKTR